MAKIIRKVGNADTAMVSLPKMLFQKDYARNKDWGNRDLAYGDESLGHDAGQSDRPYGVGDSETVWSDGVPRDGKTGALVIDIEGGGASPWLPTDIASLRREEPEPTFSDGRLNTDIGAMVDHPMADAVIDTRQWPVPGHGRPARKGPIGPNGLPYSDGRYAPRGGFRGIDATTGKPKAHYGIDLPAPVGLAVQSADGGTIYSQGKAPGFGKYTAIRHDDGRIGIYAHLDDYESMPAGTKVVQGQPIGHVGMTGNAATKGSHLHFELREDRGKKTLGKISAGAASIDPTTWAGRTTVAR